MLRRVVVPVIFGLAGAAVLISLGQWQLRRLAWKEDILGRIEARINADPVALDVALAQPDTLYTPVQLTGETGARELHVLVSHKPYGAGYRVVVAFHDVGSDRTILLDRGFIPTADKNGVRPPAQGLSLTGHLHQPDDRGRSTPQNDPAANIWFARDIEQMSVQLGTDPVLVVAGTDTGAGILPLPLSSAGIPNDHKQYAITWFLLSVVWLGMTALYVWRITRKTQ